MPPIETVSETSGPKKQLKFLRNTAYNGSNYGPDYESDTCEVDSRWAVVFLQNGRAVEANGPPATGTAQTRDPEAETRDPDLVVNKKK